MQKIKKYLIENFDRVKNNSQDIRKDDVFLALAGTQNHGNDYINDALDRGAKYIITDRKPQQKFLKKNINVVSNTLDYLYTIAIEKRNLYKGKIIGITGSVGKTSVKENLKYFLSPYFNVSASIKSYNNYLGVIISLLNLDLDSQFAVFELGTNNFYEIRKLTSMIMPSQVIITNIYPTHLENLINTKNIAKEKSDIFNKTYNPKVELTILPNYNIDEKYIIKKAQNEKIFKIITFGDKKFSNLNIDKIKNYDEQHLRIYLNYEKNLFSFIINRDYYSRINNILICFLVFIYNDIDLNLFFSKTKNIPLIEGRGLKANILLNNKHINLIDESYNASPKTMKMCIEYLDNLVIKKNQKKILILGEMKELGEYTLNFHIDLIRYLSKKKIDNVFISGKLFKLALKNTKDRKISFMLDIKSILYSLKKIVDHNDIILIKGSNSSFTNELTKILLKSGDK